MRKTTPKQGSKKGFTLIELSIVLVIIGLIVGGVLVGQDLIKAAELRATISQLEKYSTAVNTFRLKYNGIPGDLQSPATFFTGITSPGSPGNGEGDGDSLVEDLEATGDPRDTGEEISLAGESALFWFQLSQAGLISEATTHASFTDFDFVPTTGTVGAKAGSGRFAIAARDGRNYFVLGNPGTAASTSAGDVTWTAALTPNEAFQLDSKVDDGVPNAGQTLGTDVAAPVPGTASSGTCDNGTTYNLSTAIAEALNCNLSFRASF